MNINVLGYQRNGSGVCRERTPELVTKNSSGDRYSYQVHTNEVLSRRIPGKLRSQLSASYGKRTGDLGNREPAKLIGTRVPVAQHKKYSLTKTNGETGMKYGPSPGALRRERRASPPKYRAGTVSPLTPATRGRLKPSRFAVSSSVFGRRNAWGSMKMESVQTGWA